MNRKKVYQSDSYLSSWLDKDENSLLGSLVKDLNEDKKECKVNFTDMLKDFEKRNDYYGQVIS
jgi:hypothetical protein